MKRRRRSQLVFRTTSKKSNVRNSGKKQAHLFHTLNDFFRHLRSFFFDPRLRLGSKKKLLRAEKNQPRYEKDADFLPLLRNYYFAFFWKNWHFLSCWPFLSKNMLSYIITKIFFNFYLIFFNLHIINLHSIRSYNLFTKLYSDKNWLFTA